MKLTKDLIVNLMVESPSFREFAANELMQQPQENTLRDRIRNEIRSHGPLNKIAQIKFIRANYRGEAIKEAFPDYTGEIANGPLSLRDSKYFIDWFVEKNY